MSQSSTDSKNFSQIIQSTHSKQYSKQSPQNIDASKTHTLDQFSKNITHSDNNLQEFTNSSNQDDPYHKFQLHPIILKNDPVEHVTHFDEPIQRTISPIQKIKSAQNLKVPQQLTEIDSDLDKVIQVDQILQSSSGQNTSEELQKSQKQKESSKKSSKRESAQDGKISPVIACTEFQRQFIEFDEQNEDMYVDKFERRDEDSDDQIVLVQEDIVIDNNKIDFSKSKSDKKSLHQTNEKDSQQQLTDLQQSDVQRSSDQKSSPVLEPMNRSVYNDKSSFHQSLIDKKSSSKKSFAKQTQSQVQSVNGQIDKQSLSIKDKYASVNKSIKSKLSSIDQLELNESHVKAELILDEQQQRVSSKNEGSEVLKQNELQDVQFHDQDDINDQDIDQQAKSEDSKIVVVQQDQNEDKFKFGYDQTPSQNQSSSEIENINEEQMKELLHQEQSIEKKESSYSNDLSRAQSDELQDVMSREVAQSKSVSMQFQDNSQFSQNDSSNILKRGITIAAVNIDAQENVKSDDTPSLLDRRNTGRSNLYVETSDLKHDNMQTQKFKPDQMMLPVEQLTMNFQGDQLSSLSNQRGFRGRKHAFSVKRSGSPSMKTEVGLMEILSQDSAIFRKAIGEKISGCLDVDIRQNLKKKESKLYKDFLNYDQVSDESSQDQDKYSPKNLRKQIPTSNLFKDMIQFNLDNKDFDWRGNEEYFQFLDEEYLKIMNSPNHKGRALWAFMFESMTKESRFQKLKQIIQRAKNMPLTQEQIEKRKSFEEYLKKQQLKIQGDQSGNLDETSPVSVDGQKLGSNYERDQVSLPQILTLPQIELMKQEINSLFRMKKIDDHEFKMLKIIIGYKHPEEIKQSKLKSFRKQQANIKNSSAFRKSRKNNESPLPIQKLQSEEWKMVDLIRQDELQTLKETAKSRIDQFWDKNPFHSYRERQKSKGNTKFNTNFVTRNILKCHENRQRQMSHTYTIQVDSATETPQTTKNVRLTPLRTDDFNVQPFQRPNNLNAQLQHMKRRPVPLQSLNVTSHNQDLINLGYRTQTNQTAQIVQNRLKLNHQMLKTNLHSSMEIRKSDFASRAANRVRTQNNSFERKNEEKDNKFKSSFNYIECSQEMDQLRKKYGVDFYNLPFEIVRLFIRIFTHFLDLTNARLDQFREKILEIRLQDIQQKENDQIDKTTTEASEKVKLSDFGMDSQEEIDPNEALAQQLDYQYWNKTYQQLGIFQSGEDLNNELARYLVANIEVILNQRLAKRLKTELNLIAQRYCLVRSIIKILEQSISYNQNSHHDNNKNKLKQQNFKFNQANNKQKELIIDTSELEIKTEQYKVLLNPKYKLKTKTKKQDCLPMIAYIEKQSGHDACINSEIDDVILPSMRLLFKFCSNKVQSDPSIKLIMFQKLLNSQQELNNMIHTQDLEIETEMPNSNIYQVPKLKLPVNLNRAAYVKFGDDSLLSDRSKAMSSLNTLNKSAQIEHENIFDQKLIPNNLESRLVSLQIEQKLQKNKDFSGGDLNIQRPKTQTANKFNAVNAQKGFERAYCYNVNQQEFDTNTDQKNDFNRMKPRTMHGARLKNMENSFVNQSFFNRRKVKRGTNKRYEASTISQSFINKNLDPTSYFLSPQNMRESMNSHSQTKNSPNELITKGLQVDAGTSACSKDKSYPQSPISGPLLSTKGSTNVKILARNQNMYSPLDQYKTMSMAQDAIKVQINQEFNEFDSQMGRQSKLTQIREKQNQMRHRQNYKTVESNHHYRPVVNM